MIILVHRHHLISHRATNETEYSYVRYVYPSSTRSTTTTKLFRNWDHEIIPRSVPCVVSCDTYIRALPRACCAVFESRCRRPSQQPTHFSFHVYINFILWIFLTENSLKRKSKTIVSSFVLSVKYRLFHLAASATVLGPRLTVWLAVFLLRLRFSSKSFFSLWIILLLLWLWRY